MLANTPQNTQLAYTQFHTVNLWTWIHLETSWHTERAKIWLSVRICTGSQRHFFTGNLYCECVLLGI